MNHTPRLQLPFSVNNNIVCTSRYLLTFRTCSVYGSFDMLLCPKSVNPVSSVGLKGARLIVEIQYICSFAGSRQRRSHGLGKFSRPSLRFTFLDRPALLNMAQNARNNSDLLQLLRYPKYEIENINQVHRLKPLLWTFFFNTVRLLRRPDENRILNLVD